MRTEFEQAIKQILDASGIFDEDIQPLLSGSTDDQEENRIHIVSNITLPDGFPGNVSDRQATITLAAAIQADRQNASDRQAEIESKLQQVLLSGGFDDTEIEIGDWNFYFQEAGFGLSADQQNEESHLIALTSFQVFFAADHASIGSS